jgi:hypothetical protein
MVTSAAATSRAARAAKVVLSAAGHNLRIVLDWLTMLLRLILIALWRVAPRPKGDRIGFLTDNQLV